MAPACVASLETLLTTRNSNDPVNKFSRTMSLGSKRPSRRSSSGTILKGAFPTIYTMNDDNERLSASNLEELIEGAVKLIEQAEHYANKNLKYTNPKTD